jgi:hypothetical protein
VAVFVDDGDSLDAVLRKEVRDFGLLGGGRDGIDFCGHHVFDGFLWVGGDEVFEGDNPEESLVFVEDVGVVDGFHVAELLPQVADGLVDGGIGAKAGEARVHEAACDVFAKGKEGFYFVFGFVVEKIEEILSLALGRFLDEIRGIVGSEEAHVEAAFALGEGEQEDGLSACIESEEEIVHEFARQGFEAIDTLPTAETGPEVQELVGSIEGMSDHRGSLDEGIAAPWR